jgi:hypothetical protein
MAEAGLSDLIGEDPNRRIMGLCNLVVYGVATTQALKNLSTPEGSWFEDWYAPIQAAMRTDPLMRYFWKLRSDILKKGSTGQISPTINVAGSFDVNELMANPPPGASGLVLGDETGGIYWNVTLPDGSPGKHYIALPESMKATVSLHFDSPPLSHQGQVVADTSIENLARLYFDYLRGVVQKAADEFVPRSTSTRPKASS